MALYHGHLECVPFGIAWCVWESSAGSVLNAQNLLMMKFNGMLMIRLISGATYFEMPSSSIYT